MSGVKEKMVGQRSLTKVLKAYAHSTLCAGRPWSKGMLLRSVKAINTKDPQAVLVLVTFLAQMPNLSMRILDEIRETLEGRR